MDPLSITASVATLLGSCITVCVSLRKLLHSAAENKTTLTAMLTDVKALRQVLQSMEQTFEEMNSDKPETGHIGSHWTNLSKSLEDGRGSLARLQTLLEDADKDVKLLDTIRREARLKSMADQIANCRQEIQTYRDTLQLSLQTIIFWNQVSIKDNTNALLSNSETMHQDIHRLATNLDVKLTALEALFQRQQASNQLATVGNLRATVTSAATVISSGATLMSNLGDDTDDAADLLSDLGDWHRSGAPQATLEWIHSESQEEALSTLGEAHGTPPDWPLPPAGPNTVPAHAVTESINTLPSNSNPLVIQRNLSTPENDVAIPANQAAQSCSSRSQIRTGQISSTSPAKSENGEKPKAAELLSSPKKSRRSVGWFKYSSSRGSLTIKDSHEQLAKPRGGRKNDRPPKVLKIVFVGDGASGKTCLISRLSKGAYPEEYIPTVFENYAVSCEVDKQPYVIGLWDTAGQSDYDRLRPLSYPDADAFVITFSIASTASLESVKEKWISELRHFGPNVPIFLVGCQLDLRFDPMTIGALLRASRRAVTVKEGKKVAEALGAVEYLETSAKTSEGTREAFEVVIRGVLEHEKVHGQNPKRRSVFQRLFGA